MENDGEFLGSDERVVVSPASGVFVPADGLGDHLTPGSTLGVIRSAGEDIPVLSPFSGRLVSLDAVAGQRVLVHERIGWLRSIPA